MTSRCRQNPTGIGDPQRLRLLPSTSVRVTLPFTESLPVSTKSKAATFLLCNFLGPFGAHRFYLGRTKTALLMLLTFGGLGLWWMIDAVLIIGDKITDVDGNQLHTAAPSADSPQAGLTCDWPLSTLTWSSCCLR